MLLRVPEGMRRSFVMKWFTVWLREDKQIWKVSGSLFWWLLR